MTASQPSMPDSDRRRVGEVARDDLAAELGEPRALLGVARERPHLVASLAELGDDAATDEAGASRDEDLHRLHPIARPTPAYT